MTGDTVCRNVCYLSKEEERKYFDRWNRSRGTEEVDQKAFDVLVLSVTPWALEIAARYMRRKGIPEHRREECEAAALFGVVRSLNTFNPDKSRLSTFVVKVCISEMEKDRLENRTIRIPSGVLLGKGSEDCREKANRVRRISQLNFHGHEELKHRGIVDKTESGISSMEECEFVLWAVNNATRELKRLPERERLAILGRIEGKTFGEIAEPMGISKQRAQQLHRKGLRKIRKGVRIKASSEEFELMSMS